MSPNQPSLFAPASREAGSAAKRYGPWRRCFLGLVFCGRSTLIAGFLQGCATQRVPDPAPVLAEYRAALTRGDAAAVHRLLTRSSRQTLRPDAVKWLMRANGKELHEQLRSVTSPKARVAAAATVRFIDGELMSLAIEGGQYRISSVSALPALASTPEQALSGLRAVLARRSYAGLTRVMTRAGAGSLEAKLTSLVRGLAQPEALEVKVDGDRATVDVPGGHRVELQREGGFWKIRDFE